MHSQRKAGKEGAKSDLVCDAFLTTVLGYWYDENFQSKNAQYTLLPNVTAGDVIPNKFEMNNGFELLEREKKVFINWCSKCME